MVIDSFTEYAMESEVGFEDLTELAEQGSIRLRRTRDFRIDNYSLVSPSGDARTGLDTPERKKRVKEHRKRIQAEMKAQG